MNQRAWLRVVFALYGVLGLGYSVLLPLWEAPDEPDHYELALYHARVGGSPPRGFNREAMQPPLYYWLASRPLLLLDRLDPAMVEVYYPQRKPWGSVPLYDWSAENHRFIPGPQLLRWMNLVLGFLTLWFIYRGVQRFAPRRPEVALATVALAGLTPQFLHLNASVSNDPLAYLAGACLFWLLGGLCAEHPTRRQLVWAAVAALCLPALTKLTALPMALAVVVALCWRTRDLWSAHKLRLLVAGLLVFALALLQMWIAPTAAENLWTNILNRALYMRSDVGEFLPVAAERFPRSYWGYVGWLSVGLPWAVVLVLTVLASVGALATLRLVAPGFAARVARRRSGVVIAQGSIVALAVLANSWLAFLLAPSLVWLLHKSFQDPNTFDPGTRRGFAMLWITLGLTISIVTKNALATEQFQGRFLFLSIGALSALIATGWWLMLPRRATAYLHHATLGLMIALNLFLWFGEILPTYYQPVLD